MSTDSALRGTRKVFYNSFGTGPMYDIIREAVPPGFELVTLSSDQDEERNNLIRDCVVAVVAAKPLTADVVRHSANLKLVHHQGVGYQDTVPCQELARRGIPLALTPEGTTIGVAEHTILLALAVCRRLTFADSELRQGRWHVNSLRPVSRELFGSTVGYIGMGRIGQESARRFRSFSTTGIYFDPYAELEETLQDELGIRAASLDQVLTEADVLTLHVPATPETTHLIDENRLALMKPSAIIINTARGKIIDETALIKALEGGAIAGAGLDVFETEPVARNNPLLKLDNVVLTPHISAGTREALRTKMQSLFENLNQFFLNGRLDNEVDLSTYC